MAETALIVSQLYYSVRVRRLLLMTALSLLAPATGLAASVVVLGSDRDAETKETLDGAMKTAPDFVFADVDGAETAEKLSRADVVLVVGTRALTMARAVVPDKPIVYAMVPATDVVASRAVTGVALEVPAFPQLAVWKQIRFDGQRVGVIYDPKVSAAAVSDAGKAAAALSLTLVLRPASDPGQVRAALTELAPKIDLLWLIPDRRLFSDETARAIIAFGIEKKIPVWAFSDDLVQAGAFASVLPDGRDIGRRAARLAIDLAGRAPETRLPVPAPMSSPGSFIVNARTAELLGLEIPDALLRKARKVYR
jgi:putative ABC transport system substrate-binding protein